MDKPVNKKPKLKKQEILPKRVGGIYEKIYEYENIKTAIKAVCSSPNATKSKKNEKTNAKQQKIQKNHKKGFNSTKKVVK